MCTAKGQCAARPLDQPQEMMKERKICVKGVHVPEGRGLGAPACSVPEHPSLHFIARVARDPYTWRSPWATHATLCKAERRNLLPRSRFSSRGHSPATWDRTTAGPKRSPASPPACGRCASESHRPRGCSLCGSGDHLAPLIAARPVRTPLRATHDRDPQPTQQIPSSLGAQPP